MEIVQPLVVMVSKLSSEVQQVRIDNKTMKVQLRELQQAHTHVQSTRHEAATTPIPSARSYRDVVCVVDGKPNVAKVTAPAINSLPEPSLVMGENPSSEDYVTVVKKWVTPSPVNTALANTTKKARVAMIGVSSYSLSVVQKRVRMKSLYVSRFSPDATAFDVEKSLNDQLQLASLACTRLKNKHNLYASFHVSIAEDDLSY